MKDNYLSAQYHRLGKNKAIVAVSHSLIIITYHLLQDKKTYQDLGADYFVIRDKERMVKGAVRRLETLGYTVTVEPPSPQLEVSS